MAQSALDCSSVPGSARARGETKALIASFGETMDRQQAELEASLRDARARATWSEQDRARFSQTVLRSKQNTDFNKEIALLRTALRGVAQAALRDETEGSEIDCQYFARMQKLIRQLGSVYQRQSTYMNGQLRNFKVAQGR